MPEPEKEETIIELTVPPGYREMARLDVYLTGQIQNATRAKVQKGIKDGKVDINGASVTKGSYRVQAGDVLCCRIMRPPPIEIRPEKLDLDIVYEDDDVIVVNKNAGMVVHPGYGNREGTLVNALLYHVNSPAIALELEEEAGISDSEVGLSVINSGDSLRGEHILRPGIVHRLDKDTSGLLLVAKNNVAHAHLAKQFADRTIYRRYRALVWGLPEPSSGSIESHLGRDPRDRRRMATVAKTAGKRAVTHYSLIEPFGYTSLLEFRLETGRTHQIRIHALQLGHPVFGDPTYGGDRIRFGSQKGSRNTFYQNLFARLPRQALHAMSLGFVHPTSGEKLSFDAPVPDDMAYVIERVRSVDQF